MSHESYTCYTCYTRHPQVSEVLAEYLRRVRRKHLSNAPPTDPACRRRLRAIEEAFDAWHRVSPPPGSPTKLRQSERPLRMRNPHLTRS